MKSSPLRKIAIGSGAMILGIAIGLGGGSLVNAGQTTPTGGAGDFPRNAAAQTFGSVIDAKSPDQEPDLIQAVGNSGKEGYVRQVDLNDPMPKSPEEAVAQGKVTAEGRTIPVFEKDGKTQIDTFTVGGGAPGIATR